MVCCESFRGSGKAFGAFAALDSLFTSIQSIHIGFDETKLSQEPRVAYHVLGHVATRRRGCQFQLSVRAHAHECKSSKVTLPLLVPATREITAGNAGIRF